MLRPTAIHANPEPNHSFIHYQLCARNCGGHYEARGIKRNLVGEKISTMISAMKEKNGINSDGTRGAQELLLEIGDAIYKYIYLCACV